jgi:23S rRNA (cytosine1962-C5)-methyltransferase
VIDDAARDRATENPGLIVFEDDDLLVVDKPPGINTHAAAPHSSDGMFEWLRRREPRWRSLTIHQRLDKETSGVLLFGKTPRADRALARQFEGRTIRKAYVLLTDRRPSGLPKTVRSPASGMSGAAETEFRLLGGETGRWLVQAVPLTGRTHQVRIHARDAGFSILGDSVYGGAPHPRLCLHAESLELVHPASGDTLRLHAAADFDADPHVALRRALWPEPDFDAWRLIHGAAGGEPGWYVDRFGPYLLSQSSDDPTASRRARLAQWCDLLGLRGAYHKTLERGLGSALRQGASPRRLFGERAPARFAVRENGVELGVSFDAGYSVGLFLDQRENRRRLLRGDGFPAARCGETAQVLNTFAYTCAFSVCAALAGAVVTSLDLSRKALDWGRENFARNGVDPAAHDFIYGDCFQWMKRLAKKARRFDVVLLDPPTFSQSKQSGVFRAEKDYDRIVELALALLTPGGVLFCSTNCATLDAGSFVETVETAVHDAGREIAAQEFVAQPPDFGTGRGEPAYLKTLWLHVV